MTDCRPDDFRAMATMTSRRSSSRSRSKPSNAAAESSGVAVDTSSGLIAARGCHPFASTGTVTWPSADVLRWRPSVRRRLRPPERLRGSARPRSGSGFRRLQRRSLCASDASTLQCVSQAVAETAQGASRPRLDRPDGPIQSGRDLGLGQTGAVGEQDHGRSMGSSAATAASIADRSSRLVSATSGVGSGPADPISSPAEVSHSAVERSSWSACPNDEKAAARSWRPQPGADRSPDSARS